MAYVRNYDMGQITAQLGMVKILSPKLIDLLFDLVDDMHHRDVEAPGGGADWRECACGETIERNACDGSGRYVQYGNEPHVCTLTLLRQALQAADL